MQPMKISARPIAERGTISSLSHTPIHTTLGICGRQFSVFAKAILDKYTNVLNYQFDYASLIFLEQAAAGEEGWQNHKETNHTIMVTWKLLSFLLNHDSRQKQFVYQNPVLLNQITQKVEKNLLEVKSKDTKVYNEMKKCYEVYRNGNAVSLQTGKEAVKETERQADTSYTDTIDYVEQQIKFYEEKQQTGELIDRGKTKREPFRAPFSMSHSFFVNLNHLMKENKTASYKQIWQQSISKQLEKHYLDVHMQKFAKEQDSLKKEEMVFNMFREFGIEKVQEYLEKASEPLYEQFVKVMYTMTGSENQSQAAGSVKEIKGGSRVSKKNMRVKPQRLSTVKSVRPEENKKETIEPAATVQEEGYQFLQRKLLLAEYQKTESSIKDILQNSSEMTRNIILSKVEEYKDVFYDYIRNTMQNNVHNISEVSEDANISADRQNSSVSDKQTSSVSDRQSGEMDNPEVFTDAEMQVLLEDADEKKVTEESVFLKQKLNLIAIKEITESFMQEETDLLQKDRLQMIYNVLEPVSFVNESVREEIRTEAGTEQKVLLQNGAEQELLLQNDTNREPDRETAGYEKQEDGRTYPWISGKLQEQINRIRQENIKDVLAVQENDFAERTDLGTGMMGKGMGNTFSFAYDIKQVMESGSLPERKLLYLALEHTIDRMMMEEHNRSEQGRVPEELVQAKQKIIQPADTEKIVSGDWRFLMTKQKGGNILEALEELQPETREALEEQVQKNVREFLEYSEYSYGEKVPNLEMKKTGTEETVEKNELGQELWEDWKTFFEKEEIKQFYPGISEEETRNRNIPNLQWSDAVRMSNTEILKSSDMVPVSDTEILKSSDVIPMSDTAILKLSDVISMSDTKTLKLSDMVHVFETENLPERKLLYLALEHTMNDMITKQGAQMEQINQTGESEQNVQTVQTGESEQDIQTVQAEQKRILEELIQTKNKIIQTEDKEKIVSGDWQFLMTKQKETEMIRALSEMQPETKHILTEQIQKNVREVLEDANRSADLQNVNYSENLYSGKTSEEIDQTNISQEDRETETFRQEIKTITQEILTEKMAVESNLGNMNQSHNNRINRNQTNVNEGDGKSINRNLNNVNEGDDKSINRNLLNINTGDNRLAENLKLSDMIQVFETENLPERKLLYLTLEHTMNDMITKQGAQIEQMEQINQAGKSEQNVQSVQTGQSEQDIQTVQAEQKRILEELIQTKNKIIQTEDTEKRASGDWQFLMKKQRETEIVQALSEMRPETRKVFTEQLQKNIKEVEKTVTFHQNIKTIAQEILTERKMEEKRTGRQERLYKITPNMTLADMIDVFETGNLPERKLMYRALQNTVSSAEKPKDGSSEKTALTTEHLSQIKRVMARDTEERHTLGNTWTFLLNKERSSNIVDVLHQLKQNEKQWLEQHMAEQVNEFYKEEKVVPLYFEKITNSHILKQKNENAKMKFVITNGSEKNTKNVSEKLKIRQLYDKIVYRVNREQMTISNLDKNQFSERVKKESYLLTEDSNDLVSASLIHKNNEFMQPPDEEKISGAKNKNLQAALSQKMKYHEESVKLILNHTADKEKAEQKEHKRAKALEQEKIIRELEGNLLDYKAELEDRSERLEIVEKRLLSQEKQLKQINESQESISRKNLKPAEARQFMNHLKEELKMEQMRSGRI